MDSNKDNKRRKDKHEDDDHQKDKRYKRARTRSRSPPRMSERDSRRKRRHSRSRSRDRPMKQERTGNDPPKDIQSKKEVPERKTKETDMLNTRTGGAYIPPARLRMMQAQITDKSSIAYQRLAWEALKKSIHGHINKINVGNIGIIIKELLKENIVRGRGLLCRSVIQAQAASPTFTNVYAALVSAVNSRFPNIGELLLKRLVIQFKRGFKRNDKPICISSALFIAHLVNQRVAHEILALELLTLLVESPTDDSVEVAIAFLKECGQKLTEVSSKGVNAIFEMLRNILHEGQLDKRVQYMIEVMFQVWKDGFKDHPALIEELELVPEEEQFTHLLMLDDATDSQDILNVFKFDEKYEENEQKYKTLSKEILGSDAESEEEDGSGESGSEESEEEEEEAGEQKPVTIIDNTETNLVALRRTIYLTINSSLDFEECAHKLMKMQLKPGQEVELCHMFLDCCAEQRTYEKFYGLLAQRFCNINRMYISPFEEIFKDSYGTAHRLDTNRLRNVSKFFAHLLFTDSISWEVLECVKLNEEDTTSSSRIYIKILFQELAEYMGLKKLNDRLKDPTLQIAFAGIFPRDNPKNTRFSINFFTSIGLGGLTDELREHLKQMPKNVPPPVPEIKLDSDSESSSSSSSSSSEDSSSDSSSSDSENERMKKKKKTKKDKTPKTPEEPEKPEKDKNVERWGHDGFYDTYGKDARRNERKPDHYERDKDNFIRPRDINRRNDDRNRQRERYESKNDEDRRRRDDRTGRDNDDKEDSRRNNREDKRRDRDQDRQYNEDRNKNRDEESRSRRELERNNDDRWRREDRSTRDENDEPRRNFREDRDDRRRNWDQDRTYSNGKNKEKNDADYRSRREPERNDQNYDDRRRRDYKDGREGNEDVRRDGRDEKQDKRRERERNDERKERVDDDTRRKREIGRIDKDSKNVEYRKEEVERKNRTDKDDKRRNKNDVSDDERSGNRHERQRKESPDRTKTRNDDKKKDVEENLDNDIQNNKKREKGGRICSKSAEEADNHDSEEKRSKKNSKNKKKKKYRSESSDESSDEDRRREEYEHDDESKCKKRDKKKRGEDKKKVKEDMSDVKRENSIHRELGGRYWETG